MVRAGFSAVLMVFLVGLGPWWSIHSLESKEGRLLVGMTIVPNAMASGAVCLDGSFPAYHLHEGSGAGARNWLLQFEGGGWCQSVESCLERSMTRRGSTKYMSKQEVFSGILSNDFSMNPDNYALLQRTEDLGCYHSGPSSQRLVQGRKGVAFRMLSWRLGYFPSL